MFDEREYLNISEYKLNGPMSLKDYVGFVRKNSLDTIVKLPYNGNAIDNLINLPHPSSNLTEKGEIINYLQGIFNSIKINAFIYYKTQDNFAYLNGLNQKPDNDWLFTYLVYDETKPGNEFFSFTRYEYTHTVAFVYNIFQFEEFKRLVIHLSREEDIIEGTQADDDNRTTAPIAEPSDVAIDDSIFFHTK